MTDLSNNSNCITLPWDPTTPFELLIDQIKECIEFANTGSIPFTVAQILNTAYNFVFNMGCFFKDSKKWNACPNNENIWENFKTHFYKPRTNCSSSNKLPRHLGTQVQMQPTHTSYLMPFNTIKMPLTHWQTWQLELQPTAKHSKISVAQLPT